ncbi:hypothetical protein F7725_019362 [Dissostichus mawsoni]|uniref:Solute carrier family 23 member 1-like n=1 Tax=Dissostichus mawsoni TaxID=36200 RepID=A0A7J5YKE2_DISMA|nr:hypothetical protein F7725_019362 [Dissostichus mawsoni]
MDGDHQRGEEGKTCGSSCVTEEDRNNPTYCVTDVPPWYLCIFLAMQHYLTAFGAITAIPLILSEGLCLQHDSLTQSQLINTIFFTSGLVTVLQVTFGVRLPILQGGTFSLVTPAMAMLSLPEWKCPAWTQNATLVNTSSPVFIEVWQTRLRTLQGSIMVASLLQILVGFSGLIGFLMRFIGPLTIAPTVSLIGLSLFDSIGQKAGSHWGISAMYILLGIGVSWLVCYLLTIFDVLPSDPTQYGHLARTDVKGDVVNEASWFTLPYPGQWGMPAVSLAGVFGMMAGIICSMAESVGDYYACARLSGAPPPPSHAINRGIGVEGLGSLLAGAFATGNGTTSFSENVAALGITKVGSRMVILLSGFFMILIGMMGKVGAIFATIPTPVMGGMLLIMFGVIAAAGISNLQSTDMNSSRNIFIFGFSIMSALVIPNWIMKNPGFLDTGVKEVDQVLQILLTTNMFVGGFLGFFLDNTIPEVYDLPFGIASCLSSQSWVRYIPFCPWKDSRSEKQSEENNML